MKREELKEIIARNIYNLYGMEGEVNITIHELNTIDGILMDIFKRNQQERTIVPLSEEHRKKISNSMKGKKLSEKTKERMRQNSQRVNVYQYTKEGELVAVWKSTREAARIGGYNNSAISKCCRGKRKTAGGYVWKYKPLGEDDINITIRIEKSYKNEHPVKVL